MLLQIFYRELSVDKDIVSQMTHFIQVKIILAKIQGLRFHSP